MLGFPQFPHPLEQDGQTDQMINVTACREAAQANACNPEVWDARNEEAMLDWEGHMIPSNLRHTVLLDDVPDFPGASQHVISAVESARIGIRLN